MTASNLRAERMRRMRCWESSVFVVGGGHGYVMVETTVDDIVRREIKERMDRNQGKHKRSNQRSKRTTKYTVLVSKVVRKEIWVRRKRTDRLSGEGRRYKAKDN